MLLSVQNLRTHFHIEDKVIRAVNGVDFSVRKNEILGVVGESGSGKSVSALSILRLLPTPPCEISGQIFFEGHNLLELSERQMQRIRGKDISMIFQEPMTSLNPALTIGDQISESIGLHQGLSKRRSWEKAVDVLELVRISEPSRRAREYPHQLSGGMKQRAMIAMAMSSNPSLLIADEPTTALDVTIQKQILFLIKDLQKQFGTSVMFITHNLGVIAEIADRVQVMYAGRVLETAPVREIYHWPRHPYTLGLLKSVPRLDISREIELEVIPGTIPDASAWPSGCVFHPRCPLAIQKCREEEPPLADLGGEHWSRCWRHKELTKSGKEKQKIATGIEGEQKESAHDLLVVRNLKKNFRIRANRIGLGIRLVKAIDRVSFSIKQGEVLGLVGESGCGKTTLGMCVLRLVEPTDGEVLVQGRNIIELGENELTQIRKDMQIISQDPYGSLNPRMRIGTIVAESLTVHSLVKNEVEKRAKLSDILKIVGLDDSYLDKFPHELSGGQRQRIAIARALAVSPKFIVCDEPVSALDVSIQAQIINLLEDLKDRMELTYLFISHDLSVVKHISDRIAIMYLGKIVEIAESERISSHPRHPYTVSLIASVPIPDPELRTEHIMSTDEIPSPVDLPPGCRFHPRCPFTREKCRTVEPELREIEEDWLAACHFCEEINGALYKNTMK